MAFSPTAEMQEAYSAHMRHDLVKKARQAHADALKQVEATAADVGPAQQALAEARKASEDAVAGRGKLSPLEAEERIDDADRRLRVAQKLHAQAEGERAEAEAGIREAERVGHEAAYRAGAVLRFRACLMVDAAHKMLKDAKALYDESTWVLETAAPKGGGQIYSNGGHGAHHPLHILEAELPYWINGIRPTWAQTDVQTIVMALVEEAKSHG